MKTRNTLTILCLLLASIGYSQADANMPLPLFDIESKKFVGDSVYFILGLNDYIVFPDTSPDTISLWATARVHMEIDSSIFLILKCSGKRGTPPKMGRNPQKNLDEIHCICEKLLFKIEENIMSRE